MSSSALDLITDACHDILAIGIAVTSPPAEETAIGLRKLNLIFGNLNTKEGFKRFERMQTFPVTVSKQSYLIGASTETPTPDFVVATGRMPVKIDHANWLLTSAAGVTLSYEIEVIEVQRYQRLGMPNFSGIWPYGMYYQKTLPSGTLWPWPVPTDIIDSLQLFWWDQFEQIAIADIATPLLLSDGMELALELTLAEALCIPFGKTLTPELKAAAAKARMDISSTKSPRLSTDGRSR